MHPEKIENSKANLVPISIYKQACKTVSLSSPSDYQNKKNENQN